MHTLPYLPTVKRGKIWAYIVVVVVVAVVVVDVVVLSVSRWSVGVK